MKNRPCKFIKLDKFEEAIFCANNDIIIKLNITNIFLLEIINKNLNEYERTNKTRILTYV